MGKEPRDPLKELLLSVEDGDAEITHLPEQGQTRLAIVLFTVLLFASGLTYFLLTLPAEVRVHRVVLTERLNESPYFKRPFGTNDLKCDWVMDGKHKEYVEKLAKNRYRIEDPDNFDDLPGDCASIRSRHRFPSSPTTPDEADFPVAIARNVFKDYYYMELMLAATYQPQNYYCYAIDKSADHLFRARIKALAKCFPNVMVAQEFREMDSAGHRMDLAHIDCLKMLTTPEKKWKYVMLLQNHDFPAKTNFEKVAIFKWLNGSNDIELNPEPGRVNKSLDWSLTKMKIFKDPKKLEKIMTAWKSTAPPKITFAKGYNEISISREAMDYMFNELDLTNLMNQVDDGKTYGIDEIVFPTLLSMDLLGIPGHYTQKCIDEDVSSGYITRHSNWGDRGTCSSGHFRHSICIYGIEDLATHIDPIPAIYVNKLMPDFDFNAVTCWLEVLYNRTFIEKPTLARLGREYYANLKHVRYQALKDEHGEVSEEKRKNFKCK
ncbi:unnamed protein product [Bursaphelenchus xylophilus]|uniref:(pine wood nematode) hypothetical protein n=1 Tax=Bursaphelenchus xylophilus TaxID=6326 RepID=A0A1I7S1N8_BURXY|nr:unnamed protein product [Bursaphelenchus xylophilus]CAG9081203.1 unnamed protein product [Bursaphelenchus xylophilus]